MAHFYFKLTYSYAKYYTKGGLYLNDKNMEILHYKDRIVSTINKFMYDRNWSIKQLSETSGLPYESVKKLVGGKINNPTIYSLVKICKAFECSLDYLLKNQPSYSFKLHNLPPRVITLLNEIADFEIYLSKQNQKYKTKYITSLIPTGIIQDGMLFDSVSIDAVNVSNHIEEFGDIIMCGLKVVGKSLHPTYLDDDILLVARDRFPLDGEIGIFIVNNKAYIRKYSIGNPIKLISINNTTDSLTVSNIDDIHFFGRILTIIRK